MTTSTQDWLDPTVTLNSEIERLRDHRDALQDQIEGAYDELERLRSLNSELMANANDLRKLAGCKQTAIEELVTALEHIVKLGISQEAIEIARAALAKVKERK